MVKREWSSGKREEIIQNISTAQRTGGIIEPLPKLQWFVNVTKKSMVEIKHLKTLCAIQLLVEKLK